MSTGRPVVLVTGGSGFVGSHVVDALRRHGVEPRIFDLVMSPWHPCDEVEIALGSITDRAALRGAMEGCAAVIHLAAVADVSEVKAHPRRARKVNGTGTAMVVEAAVDAGVRRVAYGSTVWVYGDCPDHRVDESTPIVAPRHLYTATKLAGERVCREHSERGEIESTILRFGIPYGPRARDAAVIPAFVERAARGEPLEVAGDGSQSRPFVYVEDLAEGIVSALAPQASNRVYNLASDRVATISEVAAAVRENVSPVEVVHVGARQSDFGGKVVSNRRAAAELDWSATTPLREGIGRYVDWWRGRERRRALVISADIGEGHDLPARAIAADLVREAPGTEVAVEDGLAAMGRTITMVIRDGSWVSFNWLPWLFDVQYWLLTRFAPTRWLVLQVGYRLGGWRLLRAIRRRDADVVVSTYPGTTAILGELRRRRRLDVPAVSAITDLAGLRFWAHPGIDLHTVTHRESIAEVEAITGSGSARWARPPTSPAFLSARDRGDARRSLGLPVEGRIVTVSGGGWGVGDLATAVSTALDRGAAAVVCLCGHNGRVRARMERRFGDHRRVRCMGFTDRMSDLLAASDVLVHSTAGLTVLEAQIRGCAVISYGFPVGHIRVNDAAYRRSGLAATARSPAELGSALDAGFRHAREPDASFASLPSVAALALDTRARSQAAPTWRLRLARAAATGLVALIAATWTLASDDVFPIFASTLDLRPTTSVATLRPEVGLLIDAPAAAAPRVAAALHRSGAHASFVVSGPADGALSVRLRSLGDEPMPGIEPGGPMHWVRTRGDLRETASALGLDGHFLYAVPSKGFSLGEYALAHSLGASPVAPAVRLGGGSSAKAPSRGDIVELDAASPPRIEAAVAGLRRAGLRTVPVGDLLAARPETPNRQ
jgi:UDP-glucose 4-epimerase